MNLNKFCVLISLLFIVQLSSCKKALLLYYGVKSPKVENVKSLEKFIKKNNFSSYSQSVFSFEGYAQNINQLSIPSINIFGKDGKYIPYPGEENCSVGSYEFIEILKYPLAFPTSDSLQLDKVMLNLKNLNGEIIPNLKNEKDFTVLIYWAKFAGKINKRDIKDWEESIRKNSNSSFEIIMVNCDLQEWWGKENLKRIGMD